MRPSGVNARAVGLLVEATSRSSKPEGRVAAAVGLPTIARATRPVTKATITITTEILGTTLSLLIPALLTEGDEPAISVEGLGVVFST
jgi:hypothetical protein